LATWDKISDEYLSIADEKYYKKCHILIKEAAKIFENEHLSDSGLEMMFCKSRLQNVIYSYIYDVERYKNFHGSPHPNDIKKAAFFIKWIVKISPFYVGIKDSTAYSKKSYELIAPIVNSIFAIKLFTIITGISAKDCLKPNFVYALHYDGASVNMMYALFER
jgi:hypothetical protein